MEKRRADVLVGDLLGELLASIGHDPQTCEWAWAVQGVDVAAGKIRGQILPEGKAWIPAMPVIFLIKIVEAGGAHYHIVRMSADGRFIPEVCVPGAVNIQEVCSKVAALLR